MNRKNLLLTALLAVQAMLVVLALLPEKKGGPKEIAFFPGVKAEDVQELVIAEKEDKSLSLVRKDSGWQIGGAEGYPANAGKVDAAVAKIAGLKSSRLVTRTAASHSRLKVADHSYNRRITVKTKDGKEETVLFGSSPSSSLTHARLTGQNEVYLARDISIWDIQTSQDSWWESKLVDLPDGEIQEVQLTNQAGTISLKQGEDKQWQVAGEDFAPDQNVVREFVDRAAHLAIAKYEGKEEKPDFGLKTPVATLILKTRDKTRTVTFGPKDKDKNDQVAKSDGSPFYVRVAATSVEPLLTRKAQDFRPAAVAAPGTPAQESAPGEAVAPGGDAPPATFPFPLPEEAK